MYLRGVGNLATKDAALKRRVSLKSHAVLVAQAEQAVADAPVKQAVFLLDQVELTGLDRKLVDKAMNELKKTGQIESPVRCFWRRIGWSSSGP